MMQIPVPQALQMPQPPQIPVVQPSYNAVKIDIHNPQVNAPACSQSPVQSQNCTAPIYSYPQAPIYEVPQQSIYKPKQEPVEQPPAVQEVPSIPPPVIVPQVSSPTVEAPKTETPKVESVPAPAPVIVAVPSTTVPAVTPVAEATPVAPATVTEAAPTTDTAVTETVSSAAPAKPAEVSAPVLAPEAVSTTAEAQKIEIKAPEAVEPKVDVNAFISKLTSSDYEEQATTMETIADMAQNSPDKATELLDVKVIDTLLGIMNQDSNKLTGPTAQQLEIRDKIMSGKPVTEAETAEANKVTPMELAERNKQYSIYTVAILQKLYASEIEKTNNTVVPMTELPGAAGIVEQVKNNPNPMVRASAIDALSYIQRPEYKQDLTTLFNIAQKDKDVNVQQAATKALDKLAKVADAPVSTPTPVVASAETTADKPVEKPVEKQAA